MRQQIIAVGRKMPAWVDAAYREYAKRLTGQHEVTLTCIATPNRRAGTAVSVLQQQEADLIRAKFKPGSLTIALDERGKLWSTREWAEQYQQWSLLYSHVDYMIGGPDGLEPGLVADADLSLALGRITMPHGLVRVVLIEQLYRVWSVASGHPYHREG